VASRQSHTWPSTVTYPPFPTSIESYTATMTPVSHFVREGFEPVAMGMVLCNDSNISQYVAMVQGLHAEGVVRRFPLVASSDNALHSRNADTCTGVPFTHRL
jgi:hypothetical protein